MNNKIFGERLRALRLAKGLSQEEFADELNKFSITKSNTADNNNYTDFFQFLEIYNSLNEEKQLYLKTYMQYLLRDK